MYQKCYSLFEVKITMNTKLSLLVIVMTLSLSLTSNAFAHKSEVVGDYLIEVGWKEEPVIVGLDNAITVAITSATENDKTNAETMANTMSGGNMTQEDMANMAASTEEHHGEEGPLENGVTDLASTLEVTVTLNGEKTNLSMTEDPNNPGMYIGKFTPNTVGYPMVHLFTTIKDNPIEVTFHPEEVRDGAAFDEMSSDGSVNVHVTSTSPSKDKIMSVKLAFTDSDGNPIENVNYDVSATQNGKSVLSESLVHTNTGEDLHSTSSLTSDNPVDIQVKILGIGPQEDKANWSGPQEELAVLHVAPEFGSIVMIMFGVALVATIGLRSKIPKLSI